MLSRRRWLGQPTVEIPSAKNVTENGDTFTVRAAPDRRLPRHDTVSDVC